MEKKFYKYLNTAENENFPLLKHELNRYCDKQIALQKMARGIEEVETITVEFPISQWKQDLGTTFDTTTIDQFLKSTSFKKEFKEANG